MGCPSPPSPYPGSTQQWGNGAGGGTNLVVTQTHDDAQSSLPFFIMALELLFLQTVGMGHLSRRRDVFKNV